MLQRVKVDATVEAVQEKLNGIKRVNSLLARLKKGKQESEPVLMRKVKSCLGKV